MDTANSLPASLTFLRIALESLILLIMQVARWAAFRVESQLHNEEVLAVLRGYLEVKRLDAESSLLVIAIPACRARRLSVRS